MESFGPYRVGDLLGRGGMGEVHRAHDTVRERDVALKRLYPALMHDQEFVERFRRECRLAARLSSPHVIPIHDFGEIDGRLYLDMRLTDGDDLARVVERDGPLSLPRALDVAAQVADALDAAHAASLVHRDVKASNVLLSGSGIRDFAYLADFGIVRALDGSGGRSLTRTNTVPGTVAYMAPELLDSGSASVASDVYALTCLLVEILTGRLPFEARSQAAMMHAHLYSEPPRVSERVPSLPTGLDEVVARGLAKDPATRPRSAGELAALSTRAAGSPVTGGGPMPPPPGATPVGPGTPTIPPSGGLSPGSRSGGAGRGAPPTAVPAAGPSGAGPPGGGAAGPGAPGGPAPAAPAAHRWRLLAVGLAAALLVVGGLVLTLRLSGATTSSGPSTAAPATTTATTVPSTTPAAAIGPTALAGQTFAVGGKDFDEQLVLCKMSVILLQSRGATATDRCGIPGSRAARTALTSGQIDLTWEYTGTGWSTILGRTTSIPDPATLYTSVRDADAPNGISWLRPTPFDNTYGIATTRANSARLGVNTVSGYMRLVNDGSADSSICVEAEFAGRDDGLPGLLRTYGASRTPPTTTLDTGVVYQAVATSNPCVFGEVFTTDGRLPGLDLVTLTDDRSYFPVYQASPVFRTPALQRAPAAGDLLEDAASRLTDQVMLGLNGQVSSEGQDPAVVARTWLTQQRLI